MADVFENILGQAQVRNFLRSIVAQNRVSHAYLFTGPAGSNKTAAARALSAALVCRGHADAKPAGCAVCEDCRLALRGKHPDVKYYSPQGASGYLIAQIRSLVADTMLAPIRSTRKVYIIDRVDLLSVQAANAFLKTLEEPPADVVMILLGRTVASVLPTIVSRCQVVPFRTIPASEACAIIVQNTTASSAEALMALSACNGSITKSIDFLHNSEQIAFRKAVLEVCASLQRADDWDILGYSSELCAMAKAPVDVLRSQLESSQHEISDFLEKSALRELEQSNKRKLSKASLELMLQLISLVRTWLRDVAAVASGAGEQVFNVDCAEALESAAMCCDEFRCAFAEHACERASDALMHNVSPQLCIDALLLEVRDVLYS